MTHRNAKIHPAMTALGAVFALSATPLLAQSTDAPVVTQTPVVDVAPAPVAADPIAPVTADPISAETAPATPARRATTTRAPAARSRPAPARESPPPRAAAAAPAAAIVAPVAQAPVAQPLPPPTEIAADPIAEPNATSIDPLRTAGLGLLGLLVLVGGWLALRSRRRRRAEEAEEAEWQQQVEAEPAVSDPVPAMSDPEPAMTAEPQPEAVMTAEPEHAVTETIPVTAAALEPVPESEAKFIGPVADLPEGFDVSRFGPNMQDAYRGPTEDNPSASLKTRLSRASGMDQQERKLDAEVEAATGEPVLDESVETPPTDAPATKPAGVHHVDGDFIPGSDGKKKVTSTFTH